MKESITYADAARCACLDTAPTCDIAVAHGKAALRINAQVDALQAFQQVDIGFHARHRIPLILGLPSRCCFVWPLRKKGPCNLCCVRDAFPSPEPRAPSPEPRAPSPEPLGCFPLQPLSGRLRVHFDLRVVGRGVQCDQEIFRALCLYAVCRPGVAGCNASLVVAQEHRQIRG